MQKFNLPSKILIASNNSGKIKEITQLLAQINIKAVAPSEIKAFENFQEPEETGKTFQENSLIKAKFYAKKSGMTALADDSGFCVEALDNQPGIHSARFALDKNGEKNFPAAFARIFKMLENKGLLTDREKISAHFICNLTLYEPTTNFHISFEGRVDGKLAKPRGTTGFGYDPIFVKDKMEKTFGEISAQEKDKISHRGDAFEQLIFWANEQNKTL